MQIALFGMGYVGCVAAAKLCEAGHGVIGVDPNPDKIAHVDPDRLLGQNLAEVGDWLDEIRARRVDSVEVLAERADVIVLTHDPGAAGASLRRRHAHKTFIEAFRFALPR